MSEQIVLPGVFPRGPYGSAQDAEELKARRRKILTTHEIVVHREVVECRHCYAQNKKLEEPCPEWHKNTDSKVLMARWPSLAAHVICESLGYATPSTAAMILRDAFEKKENWCEWIYSCYAKDPRKMLRSCIAARKNHHGYMADYKTALALVMQVMLGHEDPLFFSWC